MRAVGAILQRKTCVSPECNEHGRWNHSRQRGIDLDQRGVGLHRRSHGAYHARYTQDSTMHALSCRHPHGDVLREFFGPLWP